MSTALLEYEIDLYQNRFKLGVPSRFVEKAESALTDTAFQDFLKHVDEGTYSTASSAFAKAVKDNGVDVDDDVRELYADLKRVRLKGDDSFIPGFAENVRQRVLAEASTGTLDPAELADLEQKLKRVLEMERLLVKAAKRAKVAPSQMHDHVVAALKEIRHLMNIVS